MKDFAASGPGIMYSFVRSGFRSIDRDIKAPLCGPGRTERMLQVHQHQGKLFHDPSREISSSAEQNGMIKRENLGEWAPIWSLFSFHLLQTRSVHLDGVVSTGLIGGAVIVMDRSIQNPGKTYRPGKQGGHQTGSIVFKLRWLSLFLLSTDRDTNNRQILGKWTA